MGPAGSARSWFGAVAHGASYAVGLVGGLFGSLAFSAVGGRRARWRLRSAGGGAMTSPVTLPLADRGVGFDALREAVVGATKREVVEALGPPPAAAAVATPGLSSPGTQAAFWHANVWYYPFDPVRRAAVAVQFAAGRAVRVEFIAGLTE